VLETLGPTERAVFVLREVFDNQMRTLSRRREDYVGEWLPEPAPMSLRTSNSRRASR
jgi:hypothetical protein